MSVNGLNALLVESDAIAPHDIVGGAAIAALALLALAEPTYRMWALILIAMIAVGVTVDLAAHGWSH